MDQVLNVVKGLVLILSATIYSIAELLIPSRYLYKNVKGQIVLITGAGSGFGRLLARNFAVRHGAISVLWDINKSGMAETEKMIKAGGGRCHSYVVDVSSKEAIYGAAQKVLAEVGKVDILINNAGIGDDGLLISFPDEKVEKMYQVNTLAHYWIMKAFLPGMIENNRGHLVTISSVAGYSGGAYVTSYCGTKGAAIRFHDALSEEIRIVYPGVKMESTLICPYFTRTGMIQGKEDQIRSSRFLPIRDAEPVVDEFMDAILTNRKFLVTSYGIRFLLFLNSVLPTRVMIAIRKTFLAPAISAKKSK